MIGRLIGRCWSIRLIEASKFLPIGLIAPIDRGDIDKSCWWVCLKRLQPQATAVAVAQASSPAFQANRSNASSALELTTKQLPVACSAPARQLNKQHLKPS
jgi:hypothetical protein